MHAPHPLAEHGVARLGVADIGQVDGGGDDVVKARTCLAEQELDIVHHPPGLAARIADRDRFPRARVLAHLPAQLDSAACHNGLTKVVGKVLLGVAVSSIEWPDPAVASDDDRFGHASFSLPARSGSSSPADFAIAATAGPKS